MNVQLISVSLKIKSLFFVVIFCDHLQLEVLLLCLLQRRCSNPERTAGVTSDSDPIRQDESSEMIFELVGLKRWFIFWRWPPLSGKWTLLHKSYVSERRRTKKRQKLNNIHLNCQNWWQLKATFGSALVQNQWMLMIILITEIWPVTRRRACWTKKQKLFICFCYLAAFLCVNNTKDSTDIQTGDFGKLNIHCTDISL